MKHNDRDIDTLLKRALGSTETPAAELMQNVKYKLAQQEPKKSGVRLSLRMVAVAVITVMLITSTAFAAWYLLKPSEVADKFNNHALSKAFESKDAVIINKSVTSGDYTFTMLGIVSGKGLTDWPSYEGDILKDDRTYAIVAIQKADGTPMPSMQSSEWERLDFFATPLVKGIKHMNLSIFDLDAGATWNVIDGVVYHVVDCDNIEMFADRGLYYAICDDTDNGLFEAFIYNDQTGEYTADPGYNGTVVFDLPIDPKLADPEKAEEYLRAVYMEDMYGGN